VVSSLVFDADGHLIDGHRSLAWQELVEEGVEIPPVPYQKRNDMREAREIRLLARKLNMQRRQLTNKDKLEVIKDQLQETPERSDTWIASDLGVAKETVKAQRIAATGGDFLHLPDNVLGGHRSHSRQICVRYAHRCSTGPMRTS
jgi:hypothetical protein